MATFLLVHGPYQGAVCWQSLIPLLTRAGHRVLAPDLPACGQDTSPMVEARLSSHAGRVTALIDTLVERPILVGHDLGGSVCSQAAEQRAWRVAATVYVAGLLLPSGETAESFLADEAGRGLDDPVAACRRASVDGLSWRLPPEAAQALYFHRCRPEDARAALAQLTEQPALVERDSTLLTADGWGRVPRYYVSCTDDRAVSPAWQRRMIDRTPCTHVYELDADHTPQRSAPAALAEILLDVAQRIAAPNTAAAAGSDAGCTVVSRERGLQAA